MTPLVVLFVLTMVALVLAIVYIIEERGKKTAKDGPRLRYTGGDQAHRFAGYRHSTTDWGTVARGEPFTYRD